MVYYKPDIVELNKSAEKGNADDQFCLGRYYEQGEFVPQNYNEALKWYRRAAEQGHKSAQRELGKMYQNGEGVPKNFAEAVRWYHKAAIQGDDVAQNSLGLMFQNGHGVSQNSSEAIKWYRKAAEQGNAEAQNILQEIQQNYDKCGGQSNDEFVSVDDGGVPPDDVEDVNRCRKAAEQGDADAQYRLGNMFFTGQGVDEDNEEAIKWYHKAAGQGQADAQYQLGEIYYWGQCVDEDYHEAAKWYREAAEQGNAEAQNKLDLMYEEGKISLDDDLEDYQDDLSDDVPPDDVEDVSRYRKAAEKGDATAQFNLGVHYAQGEGVPQDYTEALKWYRKAAEQGNAGAYNNIGVMYYNGTSVPQDDIEALKCFRRAAELDDKNGQNNVGIMYEYGKGVPQSDYEAARWYHKSAEQGFATALNSLTRMGDKGNSVAQFYLGVMYADGKGVSQNYAEAVKWYRKAAEQGETTAQTNLGWMYQNGKGITQDYAEAVKWYNKAAENGSAISQFNLGCIYEKGTGVPQSDTEAMKWYRKATKQGDLDAQKKLDQLKAKKNRKSNTTDSHLNDAKDCKALLDASTPKLYKQNIFRISGLQIDASQRDIKRRFDDLKTAAEMGDLKDELNHAFALNPMPNIDEIREAAQRFQDPEKRIVDEFFWFWPLDWCKSDSDPALDALRNCDPDKALHIWSNALPGDDAPQCTIAKHNLAVLHHLKAIDSEIKAIDHDLSAEALNAISKDWRTCFKWWEDLVDDEELWSLVADRIRTIDDPRLTTGFARRLCATLPEAMDKINAMLAIEYAEKGKLSQTTNHIKYMKETHQGKDNVSKTLSISTEPLKTRVESAVETAISAAKKDPAKAAKVAFELLQSVSEAIKIIQAVLPSDDHKRVDLCDHVAEACLTCQIAYARDSEDWTTSLEILDAALKYASSKETKEHLANERSNIVINKHLVSLSKRIDEIEEMKLSIANKINLISQDLLPALSKIKNSPGMPDDLYETCADYVARYLRGLSVSEYNDHNNLQGALALIEVSLSVACGSEQRKIQEEDKAHLISIQSEIEKNNLQMQIRSDDIEITNKLVRYNDQKILVSKIQGIRYGVFIQYTNGIKTNSSYMIEITDDQSSLPVPANALLQQCLVGITGGESHRIKIECKRLLRNEEQARQDFNRILDALLNQVAPTLIQRLAENVISGKSLQIGECRLTSQGIFITTGALMWKKATLVSFSDLKFYTYSGKIHVASVKDNKINTSMSIRDTWNATLLEYIAKAVAEMKNKN